MRFLRQPQCGLDSFPINCMRINEKSFWVYMILCQTDLITAQLSFSELLEMFVKEHQSDKEDAYI